VSPLKIIKSTPYMQLATSVNDKPWVCTVFFVVHKDNVYWLSYPERRHSQEITTNSLVAATVVVKADLPVISVSLEGSASRVLDEVMVAEVMKIYIAKYNQGVQFYDRFMDGTNRHVLYCLKPSLITLFDEVNFSGEAARQEFEV
jgi:uncharacterized protein YhbP (UPF0306 family)